MSNTTHEPAIMPHNKPGALLVLRKTCSTAKLKGLSPAGEKFTVRASKQYCANMDMDGLSICPLSASQTHADAASSQPLLCPTSSTQFCLSFASSKTNCTQQHTRAQKVEFTSHHGRGALANEPAAQRGSLGETRVCPGSFRCLTIMNIDQRGMARGMGWS